jgi:hypothetical protein
MKVLVVFFSLLVPLSTYAKHPLHLSVVNMTLEEDSLKINFSVRLFQEDIITLLGILNHEAMHKNQILDSTAVSNYIKNAIRVDVDQQKTKAILKHEKSDEVEYWLFYEIKLNKIPNEITIHDKILLDIFLDQQNLVIFSFKNKEKGLTFDQQNQKQPIVLKSI